MKLEICANSYQSALNAQEAGAHRIELCSELAIGGITPTYGLLKKVADRLTIKTFVLIRPRSGNFTYSNEEFEIMKTNIQLCKELGFSGIVSGILHKDNTIDIERTQELIELSKPMSFTFHRAFDWVQNPTKALEQLSKLGVDRILTSGQEESADKGIYNLNLWQQTCPFIQILPGGGINIKNVHLFKEARFSEIHLSASSQIQTIDTPKISMNSSKLFDETKLSFSDIQKIKNIINSLND